MASSRGEVYWRMLGCYLSCVLLALLLVGLHNGSLWLAGPLVFLYVVVLALDAIFEKDRTSLDSDDFSPWQAFACRLAPYGFIVGYIAILTFYLQRVPRFGSLDYVLALASMGAVGSIAITASHELIHKRSRMARLFARAGLLAVMDMPFEYFHLRWHHKHAATGLDNHTGWYDEGFPAYLIRTTNGWLHFVCDFERARLEIIGRRFFSLRNRLLVFFGCPVLLRANDDSPELPVGYPLLVQLVHLPKQWFRVIHPLMRQS